MDEKRRTKRSSLNAEVELKKVDSEESGKKILVEITDVSKNGIGFLTREQLLIGDIFESKIKLWTKASIDAILKIVRARDNEDGTFQYGCIFVGMPDQETMRILIYQLFRENESPADATRQ